LSSRRPGRTAAHSLGTLADIHLRLGQHAQAVECGRKALNMVRDAGNLYVQTEVLTVLAAAYHELGQPQAATDHVRQAIAIADKAGYLMLEGRARTVLARLAQAEGMTEEALRQARRASAIQRETGYRIGLARALAVLGDATGDPAHWHEALDLFIAIGAGADSPEVDELRRRLRSA
jgi:tetratricopeptide (TPR) repeat protein